MGVGVYKGAVASQLVRSTLDREGPVGAPVRDILLCFCVLVLFTQVYKWVTVDLLLRLTLEWTSIPSGGQRKYSCPFHATGTGDNRWLDGPLCWYEDTVLFYFFTKRIYLTYVTLRKEGDYVGMFLQSLIKNCKVSWLKTKSPKHNYWLCSLASRLVISNQNPPNWPEKCHVQFSV